MTSSSSKTVDVGEVELSDRDPDREHPMAREDRKTVQQLVKSVLERDQQLKSCRGYVWYQITSFSIGNAALLLAIVLLSQRIQGDLNEQRTALGSYQGKVIASAACCALAHVRTRKLRYRSIARAILIAIATDRISMENC
jgi:hypothetical protein